MDIGDERSSLLRTGGTAAAADPAELFFDLVYVLAVTQLARRLVEHLTLLGATQTLVLLLAVWAAWNYTTWFTNYFDPRLRLVRMLLLGLTLASLVMSASIPNAFGGWGVPFAVAYVVLNLGRTAFALAALGRRHALTPVFQRPLVWWTLTGLLWLLGALAHGDARLIAWAAAVAVEYGCVQLGYPVPALGRSLTSDYTITGAHMAERCQLFVILALGESLLVTGANLGELPTASGTVPAFAVAFVGSALFWWIYFDRDAARGARAIDAASDPGRLGIAAYTYGHVPILAGIIAAAGADRLAITHPDAPASVAATALILAGPMLFLIGDALYRRTLWGGAQRSRVVAIGALCALPALAAACSNLVLLAAATLVLLGIACSDALSGPR